MLAPYSLCLEGISAQAVDVVPHHWRWNHTREGFPHTQRGQREPHVSLHLGMFALFSGRLRDAIVRYLIFQDYPKMVRLVYPLEFFQHMCAAPMYRLTVNSHIGWAHFTPVSVTWRSDLTLQTSALPLTGETDETRVLILLFCSTDPVEIFSSNPALWMFGVFRVVVLVTIEELIKLHFQAESVRDERQMSFYSSHALQITLTLNVKKWGS